MTTILLAAQAAQQGGSMSGMLIMMVAIWLNTDRLPLWVVSRVDKGTIRLWLILKMV